MMFEIGQKMQVHHIDVADRIPGENHAAAIKAAEEAMQADFIANTIEIDRGVVNYTYWLMRCQVEPTDEALEARKLIYDADQKFLATDFLESAKLYDQGWKRWRQVLDAYPALLGDSTAVDELIESIGHYRSLLHQLDEKFPKPFTLQDVIDADVKFHGPRQGTTPEQAPADAPASNDASPAAATPTEPSATPPATEPSK
jgi:hypothetical protein